MCPTQIDIVTLWFRKGLEKDKKRTGDVKRVNWEKKRKEGERRKLEKKVVREREISPPLCLDIARFGASFIKGLAGRWCGRSLCLYKCGFGWRLLYGVWGTSRQEPEKEVKKQRREAGLWTK